MTLDTTRLSEIVVNGRPLATGAETLDLLVSEQGFGDLKVATAVNGDFVAERARADTRVRDGDRIEILSVRQGG
jgi:sulfur carrier protein